MTTQYTRAQMTQVRAYRACRRPGLYTDIDGTGADLFTIAGGPIQAIALFGQVTTIIGAGLAVPQLWFTPTGGGGVTALCAAAASIAADAVNTLYTWTGLLAGLLTPGVGIGHLDLTGAEAGFANPITMTPGVISLVNAIDALSGVIDWYIAYIPMLDASVITAA